MLKKKMHKRLLVFIICEEGFPVDRSTNVQPLNDEPFTTPHKIVSAAAGRLPKIRCDLVFIVVGTSFM